MKNAMNGQKMDDDVESSRLVGYVRRSKSGHGLRVSINLEAVQSCHTYEISDGQCYVPLALSVAAPQRVLNGKRTVTTISQLALMP